jgi:hypothetical protein
MLVGEHLKFDVRRPGGETGVLQLSPFFNVFESTSTIGLPEGEEVEDLLCPHCGHSLKEQGRACDGCGSHAARLLASADEENVDFFICLRKSCHWHGITEETRSRLILEVAGFRDPDNERELIHSGSKLHCHCPLCSASLVEDDNLVVRVRDGAGQVGTLKLSPHLNVFRAECTLSMPRGAEAADLFCPHCEQSMILGNKRCELCGARAAKFTVKTRVCDVSFYICVRRQCHWHGLDDADRRRIVLAP